MQRTVAQSLYDDSEEGYDSGEWDDMICEHTKIREKTHCNGDTRGMALDLTLSFAEFRQRVAAKFETTPQSIMLKFRDDDGRKISLRDESDYCTSLRSSPRERQGPQPRGLVRDEVSSLLLGKNGCVRSRVRLMQPHCDFIISVHNIIGIRVCFFSEPCYSVRSSRWC